MREQGWEGARYGPKLKTSIADDTREPVVSAGGCFAANLVPFLERAGFEYLRTEKRNRAFSNVRPENLGYENLSAAYGNICTPRQLLQLLRRCLGSFRPAEDRHTDAGVIDPFRPGLRYHALTDREFDLLGAQHLRAVRRVFEEAKVFIFTLGLTEAWVSRLDGAVFPRVPGRLPARSMRRSMRSSTFQWTRSPRISTRSSPSFAR